MAKKPKTPREARGFQGVLLGSAEVQAMKKPGYGIVVVASEAAVTAVVEAVRAAFEAGEQTMRRQAAVRHTVETADEDKGRIRWDFGHKAWRVTYTATAA
eukprot:3007647-Alexandrium_andersonii.AAC.1